MAQHQPATQEHLDNGIPIISSPMPGTNFFTQMCVVRGGSRYERAEVSGISHFLEHMLFKGTKKRPSARGIAHELEGIGAADNAFTAEDIISFHVNAPSHAFDVVSDILSDQLLNSVLDINEIKNEKGVVLAEMRRYASNPTSAALEHLPFLIYGDQAAGRPIIGTERVVSNLTRKQVAHYVRRFFNTSNLVIFCAGNIPDQRELIDKLNRFYAALRVGPPPIKHSLHPTHQITPGVKVHYMDVPQSSLVLALQVSGPKCDDLPAVDILNTILGVGMSSRLFYEVRERRGLAYSIHSSIQHQSDTGSLVISAGVDNQKIEEALCVIREQLERLAGERVADDELVKAKTMSTTKLMRAAENSTAVAILLATDYFYRGKLGSTQEHIKSVQEVSAEDVRRVAEQALRNCGMNLVLAGPCQQENAQHYRELITLAA